MENITQIWKKIQSPEFNPATDMNLVETVKQVALTSQEPAKVSFGTSGWRGEITRKQLRNFSLLWVSRILLNSRSVAWSLVMTTACSVTNSAKLLQTSLQRLA